MTSRLKPRSIGYWATTGLVALAMLSSGGMKLGGAEQLEANMIHLGYPTYLMTILGFWMVAAGIVLVLPGLGRIKEWAYAGIVFAMSGAFVSHLFLGDAFGDTFPSVVLIALAVASYVLRPSSRRLEAAVSAAQPGSAVSPQAAAA